MLLIYQRDLGKLTQMILLVENIISTLYQTAYRLTGGNLQNKQNLNLISFVIKM